MTVEPTKIRLNSVASLPFGNTAPPPDIGTQISMPLLNFAQSGDVGTDLSLLMPMDIPMPDLSLGLMPDFTNLPMPNLTDLVSSYPLFDMSVNGSLQSLSTVFANIKLPDLSTYANFSPPSFNNASGFSRRLTGNMGSDIVSTAQQYIGFSERDGSYKQFTNGRKEAWCADFVSYVVKEAYRRNGKAVPAGFGSPSVSSLRQWGIKNGCYLETANRRNSAQVIAQNVKPGDVVIFKENGRSHTGIVKSVKSDGTIVTVEGNTSDKVACRTYRPGTGGISGFLQMA